MHVKVLSPEDTRVLMESEGSFSNQMHNYQ